MGQAQQQAGTAVQQPGTAVGCRRRRHRLGQGLPVGHARLGHARRVGKAVDADFATRQLAEAFGRQRVRISGAVPLAHRAPPLCSTCRVTSGCLVSCSGIVFAPTSAWDGKLAVALELQAQRPAALLRRRDHLANQTKKAHALDCLKFSLSLSSTTNSPLILAEPEVMNEQRHW